MKYLRYFLIELVLLLVANEAGACGPSFLFYFSKGNTSLYEEQIFYFLEET